MTDLRQAAQAVVDHWDSPLWKNGSTADLIAALRTALEQKAEPVAPKCGAIIEVFDKDWRMEYLSLPVGKHKLYVQQYTYTAKPQQQAEPVATMKMLHTYGTAPPQQQAEPVACGGEQEAPYIGHDCDSTLPDTMKVFCPACCTKFRAIPTSVQKLLLDAGFEPPFTAPPQRKPLTDEQQVDCLVKSGCIETVKMSFESGPYDITRPSINASMLIEAVEAAHGIKENT